MGTVYFKVEVELAGEGNGWTDITRDVREGSIRGSRGIRGSSPTDRIARTGLLTLDLLNHASANSQSKDGLYSPGHANLRSGFDIGIGIRVSAVYGEGVEFIEDDFIEDDFIGLTDIPIWTGTINRIEPESGRYRIPRLSRIEARDYMNVLATHRFSGCALLQGVSESEAAQAVVDNVSIQPRALSISPGVDSFDYFGDRARDERTFAMEELQRVCISSYQTIFMRGDGTLVVEPRNVKRAKNVSPTADLAITESDIRNSDPIHVEDNRYEIINKVQVIFSPRSIESNAVVYRMVDAIQFPTGETKFTALFTDPQERGLRAGSYNVVQPVATTDYKFNSERNGSGSDETANVSVAITACGNAAEVTVTNNAAVVVYPVDASGNVLLQVRGVAVVSKERIFFEEEDAASIAKLGENAISVDMSYQSDRAVSKAMAVWFKDTMLTEQRKLKRISLLLNPDDLARVAQLLALDISSVISVSETMTGLDGTNLFVINAVDFEVRGAVGLCWLHLELAPIYQGPTITPTFGSGHLTTSGSTADLSSYQTASIKPTGNALVLAWVASKISGGVTPNAPTLTGCGLTWVQVRTNIHDNAGDDRRRITLFRAMKPAPTTGKVTMNFAGQVQDRVSWSIIERTGVDTSGTDGSGAVVQSAPGTALNSATITATLAAFGSANNRPALGAVIQSDDVMTPESGWTLLGRRTKSTSIASSWKSDGVDTSALMNTPSASGFAGSIAVEIKMA